MRTAGTILAVVCVATVLSELVGLGFLWYRGQLTPDSLADMRLALSGDAAEAFDEEASQRQNQPSLEDLSEQRVVRILELSTREEELSLMKGVVTDTRQKLIDEQSSFQTRKDEFQKQLQELETTTASEAMEQTRGILLALQPADAVDNLMALSAEENVLLLKGMPEKSIARILQQFLGGEEEKHNRGQEVFRAISQGDPAKNVIDEALNNLNGTAASAN